MRIAGVPAGGPAVSPVSSVNPPCCNGFFKDLVGFEKYASQLILDPSELIIDPYIYGFFKFIYSKYLTVTEMFITLNLKFNSFQTNN